MGWVLALIFSFFIFLWIFYHLVSNNLGISSYLQYITAFSTGLLALIAWVQLRGIYNNSKADMLLRINQLLRDDRISNAMIILRKIELDIEKGLKNSDPKSSYFEFRRNYRDKILEKVGQAIKDSYDGETNDNLLENKTVIKNNKTLKEFLNTIEVICYLCNKKYISSEDVEELFNHELTRYFCIFEPYMDSLKRERPDGETIYGEFRELHKKIKCKILCNQK